jgi:hypothetical protein
MDFESWVKIAPTTIGALGFSFGVWQYTKAQRWKKAEFAAKELDKLSSDSTLAMACLFLDWEQRRIDIPQQFKSRTKDETFVHSWGALELAMSPDLVPKDGRDGFTWQEVMYRDIFDKFFTYIHMINHYLEINLLEKKDIAVLKYWMEQVCKSKLHNKKPIFKDYLVSFGYTGVVSLCKKLEVKV